jgi:M6 family metalloprotease-like protein
MGKRSVPQFLWDSSRGKYLLSCDVISWGRYPIHDPTFDHNDYDWVSCTGGGTDFATHIFQIVDDSVDFKDYDADHDGIVDGFFFIILENCMYSRGCGCLTNFSYKTNDTTATGDTIWVLGQRGVEVRIMAGSDNDVELTHICVHEWGHQFGLVDLHGC